MAGKISDTWHYDEDGHRNPEGHKGLYFHPKTSSLYMVYDFGIDAERGLWLLHYHKVDVEGERVGQFTFTHTIKDFTREGRFMKVDA